MTEHSDPVDLRAVERQYTESLRAHGAGPLGVGWRDEATHTLRMERLARVLDEPSAGPITVNDLGCGYGALLEYLEERGWTVSRFRGHDISDAMLDEAAKRIDRPNVDLVLGSALDTPMDFSFASGIFNVRFSSDEEAWRTHVIATLENLDAHSTRGFAFNALTTHVDFREPHLYYADPAVYLNYCLENFSRSVALLHDYPLYEWTLVVRRQA